MAETIAASGLIPINNPWSDPNWGVEVGCVGDDIVTGCGKPRVARSRPITGRADTILIVTRDAGLVGRKIWNVDGRDELVTSPRCRDTVIFINGTCYDT